MIRDGDATSGDETASAQSSLIEVFPVQRGRRVVVRPGIKQKIQRIGEKLMGVSIF